MLQLQKIDIDEDIYRMIETERKSVDEPPYLALRRLLKLPPPKAVQRNESPKAERGLPWTEDGVTVPHGTLARMEYLRGSQVFEGKFLDGRLVVNGRSFKTLSAAASALARTRNGSKRSLNGWNYWKARLPGETRWRSLYVMRLEKNGPRELP